MAEIIGFADKSSPFSHAPASPRARADLGARGRGAGWAVGRIAGVLLQGRARWDWADAF